MTLGGRLCRQDYNGYIDVNVNKPSESVGFVDKKDFQEEYYGCLNS